jgi:hypothetical protein
MLIIENKKLNATEPPLTHLQPFSPPGTTSVLFDFYLALASQPFSPPPIAFISGPGKCLCSGNHLSPVTCFICTGRWRSEPATCIGVSDDGSSVATSSWFKCWRISITRAYVDAVEIVLRTKLTARLPVFCAYSASAVQDGRSARPMEGGEVGRRADGDDGGEVGELRELEGVLLDGAEAAEGDGNPSGQYQRHGSYPIFRAG